MKSLKAARDLAQTVGGKVRGMTGGYVVIGELIASQGERGAMVYITSALRRMLSGPELTQALYCIDQYDDMAALTKLVGGQ